MTFQNLPNKSQMVLFEININKSVKHITVLSPIITNKFKLNN